MSHSLLNADFLCNFDDLPLYLSKNTGYPSHLLQLSITQVFKCEPYPSREICITLVFRRLRVNPTLHTPFTLKGEKGLIEREMYPTDQNKEQQTCPVKGGLHRVHTRPSPANFLWERLSEEVKDVNGKVLKVIGTSLATRTHQFKRDAHQLKN